MNTVARPATVGPGHLRRGDGGIGGGVVLDRPLDEQLGRALAHQRRRVRTFSTSAPEPDSPVEYDSIAMRGSMPNCDGRRRRRDRDVGELLAVGSGMTAQSP